MNVRVVVRDNMSERSVVLVGRMLPRDLKFLNELGERIAQGTEWEIVVVAVEEGA